MAGTSKRGFASMDPQKQREIASKGGKAAHAKGTAHEFTREEAVQAGRKGGRAAQARAHQQSETPMPEAEQRREGERAAEEWQDAQTDTGDRSDLVGMAGGNH